MQQYPENFQPNVGQPVYPAQPIYPNQPQPTVAAYTPYLPKPKRDFSGIESVFAWLCFVIGYLFCRAFPVNTKPLGGLIFLVILFCVTATVLKIKKASFGKAAIAVGVSGLVVALSLFFSANAFIQSIAYLYAIAAYCYFVYASFENRLAGGFSGLILIDFFKALFVMPFSSFGQIFYAVVNKNNKFGSLIKKAVIGIAVAFMPTVIILLLLSYDTDFTDLLGKIFDFNIFNILSHLVSIAFGIPIGMYIYGLFISSADKNCRKTICAEKCSEVSGKMQIASWVTVLVATMPILAVYVIFFISQWKYYTSGFVGELPDAISYAAYAREGFFQLCAVSVINLIIIGAVNLFIRRNADGNSGVLRILSVIFSVFTLVLISTAIAKLVMYIGRYGLTQKRVYAAWFMAVLALIFFAMIIKQFAVKIKLIPTSVVICVIMFAALGLCSVDSYIAKYNVDGYLSGELETVDVDELAELGDPALPHIIRLEKEMESRKDDLSADEWAIYCKTSEAKNNISSAEDNSVFALTLPKIKAKSALEA